MQPHLPDTSSDRARRILALTVNENVHLCEEHYRLRLAATGQVCAQPGQFLQLCCKRLSDHDREGSVLLPRPFSIGGLRVLDGRTEIDVIYRVVGPGTTWMTGLRTGERVQALGPLGNGFGLPADRTTAYVVGGGVGLPPIMWLAEHLRAAGHEVVAFCGARTARLMALTVEGTPPTDPTASSMAVQEFSRHGAGAVLTTDDGSLGVRGLVGSAMMAYHAAHPCPTDRLMVYTCGPEPMMAAVAGWCIERDIRCQVCMERMMACGVGTCQSCVVAVRDDRAPTGHVYKLCCTDGPVFDARDIVWDPPAPHGGGVSTSRLA